MSIDVIKSIKTMQQRTATLKRSGERIGLVPTMGYLHEGHLSLVDIARDHSEITVMSIFVNPKQFDEGEDLSDYPRDFERDRKLTQERGVDILFYPDSNEMYPDNFSTTVLVEGLSERLCGVTRPIHFQGVTTVVTKLFNIIQPDVAVFGQKDAQQAVIIQRLAKDLNFPIDIVIGPTIREKDGLAMSSRNTYLSSRERPQALSLQKSLQEAKKMVESGERNSNLITSEMRSIISEQPDVKIDYIEIVDLENLEPLETIDRDAIIAVAVFLGTTRLIDNIIVNIDGSNTIKIENT